MPEAILISRAIFCYAAILADTAAIPACPTDAKKNRALSKECEESAAG